MCDYSLKHMASRPATVDDKLVVSKFSSSLSLGFTAGENKAEVVCVLPGTELAFDENIVESGSGVLNAFGFGGDKTHEHKTARFRQIDLEKSHVHHDAFELPDGSIVKLQNLKAGQTATVLQLPAAPKTAEEEKAQERLEVTA